MFHDVARRTSAVPPVATVVSFALTDAPEPPPAGSRFRGVTADPPEPTVVYPRTTRTERISAAASPKSVYCDNTTSRILTRLLPGARMENTSCAAVTATALIVAAKTLPADGSAAKVATTPL